MSGSAPRRRVYLHIGLHKTGTTYLQHVLRRNRDELSAQGVFFPGGEKVGQMLAVWDLFGRRPRGAHDGRVNGQWQALTGLVEDDHRPVTLISEEYLSLATPAQAVRAVAGFPSAEVHVVVTARDIGRIVVSQWQEEVKNNQTWSWQEYAAALRDPRARAKNPARHFWLSHDLPVILETWRAAVPADRIHVVTVPPPGSDPAQLLARYGSVVGFEPALLTNPPGWSNESLGVAATEVVRRLNQRLDRGLSQRQYNRVIKIALVPEIVRRQESSRFGLPPEHQEWARGWARDATTQIEQAGYRVVGELSDLLPVDHGLRRPDDATDDEVLDAAITALAGLAEVYAKAWWSRKVPDRGPDQVALRTRVASTVRGAGFRARRRAAQAADRNRVAAKAMAGYLQLRAVRRRAARRRALP
jgi:hypothetical protein